MGGLVHSEYRYFASPNGRLESDSLGAGEQPTEWRFGKKPERTMGSGVDEAAAFIVQHLDATTHDLLRSCRLAGLDLAPVMDLLADPFAYLDPINASLVEELAWEVDPGYALVELLGKDDALATVGRTQHWRDVDVVRRHSRLADHMLASQAIAERLPIIEAIQRVERARSSGADGGGLLEMICGAYALPEIAGAIGGMTDESAEALGAALRRTYEPLEATELMLDRARPNEVVECLTRFWQIEEDGEAALDRLVGIYAQVTAQSCRSLGRVVDFCRERGAPEWWIPILERHGLRASQVALFLKESGYEAMAVVSLLTSSGYSDDELLGALTDNAYANRATLFYLRESGWSASRLTASLSQRGALAFEVRDQLTALGVPRDEVRLILLAHYSEESVMLVLPD